MDTSWTEFLDQLYMIGAVLALGVVVFAALEVKWARERKAQKAAHQWRMAKLSRRHA